MTDATHVEHHSSHTKQATNDGSVTQLKKDPNDPDFDQINPTIIAIARHNGFTQQPIQLFLQGQLTWLETLELIVCSLGREFTSQRELVCELVTENFQALSAHQPIALLLNDIKKQEARKKKRKGKRKYNNWKRNWTYSI